MSFQQHSRTLIPPGRGSAPSPPLLRAAEAGRAQVPPFSARPAKVVVPQDRVKTMAEEPRLAEWRGHRATDSGLSSRECTPLSPGMQPWVFRPQKPTLYLLQTKSVCTENSPAGAVLRLQTQSYELKFYASYFNPVSFVLIIEVFRAQPSLPPPRLPRARGSSGS